MKVGTILLTKSNKYVDAEGNLPKRPRYDKELLSGILETEGAVSSIGYDMLPLSIQRHVVVTSGGANTNYAPVTIKELSNAEMLIVSRSPEDFVADTGKVFRLDNFRCLVKDRKVEIWIRIQ